MAGFHNIIDKVLVVKGFLEMLIYAGKGRMQDFGNVIQLSTDIAG